MKSLLENTFLIVLGTFIFTFLVFYGIDHFIMAIQGLPLNLDLTPAQ